MMAWGAYAVFLVLAAIVTVKVGLVLKRHGDLLLHAKNDLRGAVEPGPDRHLISVNRLTLLGYCLVTAGAAVLLLRIGGDPQTMTEALAFLVTRIGVLLVVLGVAHFQCLSVMARASAMPAELRRDRTDGRLRPRQAKEDPLDRVFEAARLDAPFGG